MNNVQNILQGKIIISTRPVESAIDFAEKLEHLGALVYHLPMIEIVQSKLTDYELDIVDNLNKYDWLIFQSANGVKCFFDQLPESQKRDVNSFIKVGSIGKKTTATLQQYNVSVDFENSGTTGNDFAAELKEAIKPHEHLLIPTVDIARKVISDILPNKVDYIIVYKNVIPKNYDIEILDLIKKNEYDIISFASPSSVLNLKYALGSNFDFTSIKAVSIGTSTANELEQNGVASYILASNASNEGLVSAIINYFNK